MRRCRPGVGFVASVLVSDRLRVTAKRQQLTCTQRDLSRHPASAPLRSRVPSASPASAITSAGSRAKMRTSIRAAPEGLRSPCSHLRTVPSEAPASAREFLLRQAGLEPGRRHEPLASRSRPDVDDRDKPGHDGWGRSVPGMGRV